MGFYGLYPLVILDLAIENGHLQRIFPLKMVVIFHSYVKSQEGEMLSILSYHYHKQGDLWGLMGVTGYALMIDLWYLN